ncbi:hypothetical protein SKAU_G00093420 [Synaphobranchus kaupii]|uniref:Uncharacterized protein n=1 Tax=Synaphobranchus kaupii TaxID=118154 RepID=A0A9Q1FXP6_SYNKA|nr:hypothetical protein SKAU_G00093420 [Synaphobranchus kaupii]
MSPAPVQHVLHLCPMALQFTLQALEGAKITADLVHLFGSQQDPAPLLERLDEAHDSRLHHRLLLAHCFLHQALLGDGGCLDLQFAHLLVPHLHLGLHGLSHARSGTQTPRRSGRHKWRN